MDFTPDLSAFRSVLTSVNNVHSFSKLTSRGGNEEILDHVIESISRFLKDRKFIDDAGIVKGKESEMKKFALFIILNSDLSALNEMVDSEHIDSVIWVIPTIPKFLMTYMIFKLHMEGFLHDFISFTRPQLAVEIATAVLEKMRWLNPEDSLPVLSRIASAAYRLNCRLHFFKLDNDVLSDILTGIFNVIQQSLNYFTSPPNAEKLLRLKRDAEYQYKGERLSTMLTVVKECIDQFGSTEKFISQGFDGIYQLTYEPKGYNADDLGFEMYNSPNRAIYEYLEKCLTVILDKCMELVMDVSVDLYCAWSEFKKDGREMQQIIGNQSYELCAKIQAIKSLSEHPVCSMLQEISRKPDQVEDVINKTGAEAIIENINKNDATKHEWIKALVYKTQLWNDSVLVQQLLLNIDVLSHEEGYVLYQRCKLHLEGSADSLSDIKILAVKSFQKCKTTTKYEILQDHFNENYFNNDLETAEFHNMMTGVFNKIIDSQDVDLSEILCVFLQNPQTVYEKIVTVAADSNEQIEVMVNALRLLETNLTHQYREQSNSGSCFYTLLRDFFFKLDTEPKQRNFVRFICGLKETALITDDELLHTILMPNLFTAMTKKDMQVLNNSCKVLYDAISLNKLMESKAPMLVMLAQVLDVARWTMDTFHGDRVNTLQTVLLLQNSLISFYSDDIPEDEKRWLKQKLENIKPLNRFYYRTLWDRSGNNFVEEVRGQSLGKIEELLIWLSQTLCATTLEEWYLIWDSLDYMNEETRVDVFSAVVKVLVAAEKIARKGNTWNCMLHVFGNYVSLLRYKYLSRIEEPYEEVTTAVDKIAYVTDSVDEEHSEAVRPVVMPLVAYLVENEDTYKIDVREICRSKLKYQHITCNGTS